MVTDDSSSKLLDHVTVGPRGARSLSSENPDDELVELAFLPYLWSISVDGDVAEDLEGYLFADHVRHEENHG